jgi:hypothetical protein
MISLFVVLLGLFDRCPFPIGLSFVEVRLTPKRFGHFPHCILSRQFDPYLFNDIGFIKKKSTIVTNPIKNTLMQTSADIFQFKAFNQLIIKFSSNMNGRVNSIIINDIGIAQIKSSLITIHN